MSVHVLHIHKEGGGGGVGEGGGGEGGDDITLLINFR